jgi:putative ABC transport system permease protein
MRQRKSAYLSLVLEVALGFTVVVYALALSDGIANYATAPAGFDDRRTFVIAFDQGPGEDSALRTAREKVELAGLPGVQTVAQVELPPLSRREMPDELISKNGLHPAWVLRGDANLPQAFGVRLASGRWLTPDDRTQNGARPVMVTRSLAEKLGAHPEGTTLSAPGLGKAVVVGVADNLVRLDAFLTNATDIVFSPQLVDENRRTKYLLYIDQHADGAAFARNAAQQLARGSTRFVRVERLSDKRDLNELNVVGANRILRGTALGMVLVVLVGSFGMASSFVVERARQIAIRRALGARRGDIVRHFLMENTLATLVGILLGIAVCSALDAAVRPLQGTLVLAWRDLIPLGMLIFFVVGHVAALLPALRASRIPSATASRAA